MKKILKSIKAILSIASIVLTAVTVFMLASCDNPSNPISTEPATVNIAAIAGVTVPITGGTPVTTITENKQYTGTVTWMPAVSGTFESSTEYTATITLKAKTGYTLTGVAADFFTVTDSITTSNAANSGIVTALFPTTAGTLEHPAIIDIAEIDGIDAPTIGGIPPTSITPTAQYTGTITWNPNHPTFASATQYTATIILTAKPGYTLTGVDVDFFKIEGSKTSSIDTNSGVITVVFPTR